MIIPAVLFQQVEMNPTSGQKVQAHHHNLFHVDQIREQ
jgi:hypothetical protein